MAYTDFLLNFEDLREFLGNEKEKELTGIVILEKFGNYVESLDSKHVQKLVFALYGKWPHNIKLSDIRRGVKRAVQTKFYKEIFHTDKIPSRVIESDNLCTAQMDLHDEQYIAPQPVHLKKFKPPKTKKNRESTPRSKKPVSKFSEKVNNMNLEDLIQWALESGVTQDRIDKHKNKSVGLAKMNICNLLRHKIKNNPEYRTLL